MCAAHLEGDELKASLGYKRSEEPEWFASEKSSQAGKQEFFERSAVPEEVATSKSFMS